MTTDFTNDPSRKSFIPVAADSHFPIQNLPYGVFEPLAGGEPRCGVAIGEFVVDLAVVEQRRLLPGPNGEPVFQQTTLNRFASLGRSAWGETRRALSELLDEQNATLRDNAELREHAVHRQSDVRMHLPMEIGDYTDFYSSKEHATNVGVMFRGPDNALQPNWLHLPVAYHGRSSSILPSGVDIKRPAGQSMPPGADTPSFGPSKAMDFELEMGFFVGPATRLSEPVAVDQAEQHIFGLVLVNDWSARDIQRWEYVPLGPFLGKSFATSISPWIVTLEALEPFRCEGPAQNPAPLPYLQSSQRGTFDIDLEVKLHVDQLDAPATVCRSNFRYLYWSMRQQLAHHTCNGCNIRPGDMMASGTISGPTPDSYGSMLELAWKGERPLQLADGVTRSMLQDGDGVTMTGWAQGEGYRVGFGEVTSFIR